MNSTAYQITQPERTAKRIKELEEELTEARQAVAAAHAVRDDVNRKLVELQSHYEQVKRHDATLFKQVESLTDEAIRLKEENRRLRERVDAQPMGPADHRAMGNISYSP